MSLLCYIDNEAPALAEWNSVVQSGASTLAQTAAAAFPQRGGLGLRITSRSSPAYVKKNALPPILPGQTRYVGFWIFQHSTPINCEAARLLAS